MKLVPQLYLIVHSGSRNLGKQVCEYYQNVAANTLGRTGEGADRVLAYLEGGSMVRLAFEKCSAWHANNAARAVII